jgi:hypothetical protein
MMVVTILPNGLMVDSSSHQALTGGAIGVFTLINRAARVGAR